MHCSESHDITSRGGLRLRSSRKLRTRDYWPVLDTLRDSGCFTNRVRWALRYSPLRPDTAIQVLISARRAEIPIFARRPSHLDSLRPRFRRFRAAAVALRAALPTHARRLRELGPAPRVAGRARHQSAWSTPVARAGGPGPWTGPGRLCSQTGRSVTALER